MHENLGLNTLILSHNKKNSSEYVLTNSELISYPKRNYRSEIKSSSKFHGMLMLSEVANADSALCFEDDENNLCNVVFS